MRLKWEILQGSWDYFILFVNIYLVNIYNNANAKPIYQLGFGFYQISHPHKHLTRFL